MGSMVQGRAGTALAFILGLVIATAGTATAAKLITGKQIKDGSIAKADLTKAVQRQLAKGGTPGPGGPKGDTGAQGPAGPAPTLRDATGAVVGRMIGAFSGTFVVERDGAIYQYSNAGRLGGNFSPTYITSDCTGTALFAPRSITVPDLRAQTGGAFRAVFRTQAADGTMGAAKVYKGQGVTVQLSATPTWGLNAIGVCVVFDGSFTGPVAPLEQVAAPPDFAGPLTFG